MITKGQFKVGNVLIILMPSLDSNMKMVEYLQKVALVSICDKMWLISFEVTDLAYLGPKYDKTWI